MSCPVLIEDVGPLMKQLCKLHPYPIVCFDSTLSVRATPLPDSVATIDNDNTFFFRVPNFSIIFTIRVRCLTCEGRREMRSLTCNSSQTRLPNYIE